MLRTILISTVMIAIFSVQGLSQTEKSYSDLTVEELDSMQSRNDVILLDVRTPEEISKGKIGDALEADVLSPGFKAHIQDLDHEKNYVVYCRSGRRSVTASEIMVRAGFIHVYNLVGGYKEWIQKSE